MLSFPRRRESREATSTLYEVAASPLTTPRGLPCGKSQSRSSQRNPLHRHAARSRSIQRNSSMDSATTLRFAQNDEVVGCHSVRSRGIQRARKIAFLRSHQRPRLCQLCSQHLVVRSQPHIIHKLKVNSLSDLAHFSVILPPSYHSDEGHPAHE